MSFLVPRNLAALGRIHALQQSVAPSAAPSVPQVPEKTTSLPVPLQHGELMAADAISGAPSECIAVQDIRDAFLYLLSGELRKRVVRIYQPTRNTMQSASGKTERWRIDWDILPSGSRWENPLMGYASSADYMQGTRMSFNTKEDAARFAEKQGWDYYVCVKPPFIPLLSVIFAHTLRDPRQPSVVKRIPPKNYAENYVYKPHTLRIMRTK